MMFGSDQVPTQIEEVLYGAMDSYESLRLLHRLKPSQPPSLTLFVSSLCSAPLLA
jgi:hypothetical protein